MRIRKLCFLLCGIAGILGGILMILAAIFEELFPKPLWFVASLLMFANSIGLVWNLHLMGKEQNKD